MKERPILFSGEMVRAILDGRKTQTRRVVKPQPPDHWIPEVGYYYPTLVDRDGEQFPGEKTFGASDESFGLKCPYGQPGDRLWVRETWAPHADMPHTAIYRCDRGGDYQDTVTHGFRWSPSIKMPLWASRITLEITSVRVEMLQDITEHDASREGVELRQPEAQTFYGEFRRLWESIHSHESWTTNPWVWVIEFKRPEGLR